MENAHSTTTQTSPATKGSALFETAASSVHAILRIGAGLLFMQHGAQKLFGWLGGMGGSGTSADLISLMGLAGVLEFFGGLLIVLGLFTVPVAVVLALQMVVAYVMAHMPQGGFPVQNDGELALLYALVFAFLAANGPGSWNLNEQIRSK